MGLSRWIHNIIVDGPFAGAKWLRLVDLRRQLFNDTANRSKPVQHSTFQALAGALMMEKIQISSPIFRFQATPPQKRAYGIDCFHLSDSKVLLLDHSGSMFLCDAHMRSMVTMPSLQKRKLDPISIFIPSANADDHPNSGCLYVMESTPEAEKVGCSMPSDQFEVFEYRKPSRTYENQWHHRLLLPPPFVRDRAFTYQKISSYAVIGSNICISTMSNGTYFLDTASHTWTELGFGKLPFRGQVEYVPELKLWFGISSQTEHLVATDLSVSDMDSQPQLIGDWREFEVPPDWQEYRDAQLVNLGLGRFCIARFLLMPGDEIFYRKRIVVFTGVEVMLVDGTCGGSGNGKVKLKMKRHKSRFHMGNSNTIDDVF